MGVLFLFVNFTVAQIATFPDPENFPGSESAIYPQNAGGGTQYPPNRQPGADFFEDQINLPQLNGYTTAAGGGFTGAYPGQIVGLGVDPVRGIVVNANLNVGSSGKAATGRSGRGAASGNGFGLSETKLPARTDIHTTDFIDTDLNAGSSVVPPHGRCSRRRYVDLNSLPFFW